MASGSAACVTAGAGAGSARVRSATPRPPVKRRYHTMTSTTRYLQESRLTERRAVDADAAFARRLVLISFLGWLIAMTLIWGRDHALSSLRRGSASGRVLR